MAKRSSMVGSRELKTRLGAYLKRVRGGETILVTDRGEPVAELRPLPPSEDDDTAVLRKLAAKGLITLGTGGPLTRFTPIRPKGGGSPASEAISKDRDDRF